MNWLKTFQATCGAMKPALLAMLLLLPGCASPAPKQPAKITILPAPVIGVGDQYARP